MIGDEVTVIPTQGAYQKPLKGKIIRETTLFTHVEIVLPTKTMCMRFSNSDNLRTGLDKEAFPRYKLERAK